MNIAILGSSSQIAFDLIISMGRSENFTFYLFSRDLKKNERIFNKAGLKSKYFNLLYEEFFSTKSYDLIINFVGIVNPSESQKEGSQIFDASDKFDILALDYIKENPITKYIFLSSGAVYGGNFFKPASFRTLAKVDINNLCSTDWYAISKLYIEAKHRSLNTFSIVDLRVFNYFSSSQDLNSNFFIIDVVNALISNKSLSTSSDNISRDYITPSDFHSLIQKIIDQKHINTVFDCYTKAPIKKHELLSKLESKFGLKYTINDKPNGMVQNKLKMNYYSKNKLAKNIGYAPQYDSLNGIMKELSIILNDYN
jgi:nucleoside-diphosphate-sugar epimerase